MRSPAPYLVVPCGFILAACDGTQSALAPHGSAATDIARLTWLLVAMVVIVTLVVTAATSLSIGGSARIRGWLAGSRAIVIGGLVFPAVVLTGLLVYGIWLMRAHAAAPSQTPVAIEVTGAQWWWRVRYTSADGHVFESANEIRLPVGKDVSLTMKSADVIHSLWIPSLAGKMDLIPGRTTTLRLMAERPGIYRGACAEYCGGPHALMALHAVAMPAEEFERWLNERQPSARTLDDRQQRGKSLFEASGCGGCHAVDETNARGTIGPNLSDLGTRQSVGAGLLPMSPDNVGRFVVHGQQLKPGNKMPPFPIFSETELTELSAYLTALK